jgi:hypothetical protein
MQALHTACVLVALAGALAAQGAPRTGNAMASVVPRYPADLAMARFSPFVDAASQPLRIGPIAAGAADFDGDRNLDLWFLGHGNKPGEIAVQFGNTASLGRFYRRESVTTSSFVAATTYHTSTYSGAQLLVVDPKLQDPMLLHWNPKSRTRDPRDGNLGGSVTGWNIGKGVTEIAAADHSGDGHDDIVALQALANNNTAVHKLVMDTTRFSYLWVEQKITTVIPARLVNLRLLDLDGDGRTDFVANTPGIGILACRDNGIGGFEIAGFWPTYTLPIKDLTIGDLDGNGLDDIAVCFDQGIAVLEAVAPGGGSPTMSWRPRLFLNPVTVGPLATCRIVDVDHSGSMLIFGFPTDGKSYVIHPHNPGAFGIVKPWVESAPAGMSGAGVLGQSVIVADVDNDEDPDIVIQSPNGTDWMTLRNPFASYAPTGFTDVDKGKAPSTEGPKSRRLNVTVDIPQSVIDAKILFAEIGMYVKDPASPNQSDPDWMYWGRLMPAIDTTNKNVSFTVFYDEDRASFRQRLKKYKAQRKVGINTFTLVYPAGEWETIRGGPGLFMTMHAVDMGRRFESSNGDEPPKPKGSTLGGKWVLVAKPPSTKGDLELLPFE